MSSFQRNMDKIWEVEKFVQISQKTFRKCSEVPFCGQSQSTRVLSISGLLPLQRGANWDKQPRSKMAVSAQMQTIIRRLLSKYTPGSSPHHVAPWVIFVSLSEDILSLHWATLFPFPGFPPCGQPKHGSPKEQGCTGRMYTPTSPDLYSLDWQMQTLSLSPASLFYLPLGAMAQSQ